MASNSFQERLDGSDFFVIYWYSNDLERYNVFCNILEKLLSAKSKSDSIRLSYQMVNLHTFSRQAAVKC